MPGYERVALSAFIINLWLYAPPNEMGPRIVPPLFGQNIYMYIHKH